LNRIRDDDYELLASTRFYEDVKEVEKSESDVILVGKRHGNEMLVLDIHSDAPMKQKDLPSSWLDVYTHSRMKLDLIRKAVKLNEQHRSRTSVRYPNRIPVQIRLPGIALLNQLDANACYWIRKTDIFLKKTTYNSSWVFPSYTPFLCQDPSSDLFVSVKTYEEKGYKKFKTDWSIEQEETVISEKPDQISTRELLTDQKVLYQFKGGSKTDNIIGVIVRCSRNGDFHSRSLILGLGSSFLCDSIPFLGEFDIALHPSRWNLLVFRDELEDFAFPKDRIVHY
jgi:hypothetical protein